ncbi:hypothetical protein [Knoellia aerolata]|uniref:Uncharacterized protein n=1 Tax=Knoellia aerolata DSM 18566 TaxID=1385519 RepID=A0A0A0K2A4_9MICO|nr:hypothetical protein [Knoellia aerolata]KGN41906.1 hypothetical protein N801_04270 [Knoellia aerolata DSM 18566]
MLDVDVDAEVEVEVEVGGEVEVVGEGSSGLQAANTKVPVRRRTTGTKRPFLRTFVIVFHS